MGHTEHKPLAGGVREHVNIAPMTSLGVGGEARYFVDVSDEAHLEQVLSWAEAGKRTVVVLGGGTNVVVSDAGFDGLVVRYRSASCERAWGDNGGVLWKVGAGFGWDDLVADTVQERHAGIECLSGIPGWCGGAPIQNIGAYGQEFSDVLATLRAYDRSEARWCHFDANNCDFAYRNSIFRQRGMGRFVISSVTIRLNPGAYATLRYPELLRSMNLGKDANVSDLQAVRDHVMDLRRAKGMVLDASDPDSRSAGSFFLNPIVSKNEAERVMSVFYGDNPDKKMPTYPLSQDEVKLSAAWLIENCGYAKGWGKGRVGLSTKHSLALINRGEASALDVIEIAAEIRRGVLERSGVRLQPEPLFLGFTKSGESLLDAAVS
jgi:UDP-N-acetylmuramate dehydrogenase